MPETDEARDLAISVRDVFHELRDEIRAMRTELARNTSDTIETKVKVDQLMEQQKLFAQLSDRQTKAEERISSIQKARERDSALMKWLATSAVLVLVTILGGILTAYLSHVWKG